MTKEGSIHNIKIDFLRNKGRLRARKKAGFSGKHNIEPQKTIFFLLFYYL